MAVAELGIKVTSKGLLLTNKELDKLSRAAPAAESKVRRLNKTSAVLTRTMRGLGAAVGLTVGAMLFGSVRVLSGFEGGMSKVAAVTRASTVELAAMRDVAKELGSTTEFTAAQAADGLAFLGMAGFSAAESIAAIPAVLDLATAAAMDLGRAADISSNIMSAFSIEATEASSVTDVLAAAASRANTDVGQLGDAMKFVGPIASAMGISVNDAAAAVGVLSDAGLQGTMAGTGLRRVLSSLVNPTDDAVKSLASLGVKIADVNPDMHSLVDIVDVLAESGIGAADALTIFGDRGGPAILALTSQTGKLRELTSELNDVEGAAKTMADTMRDNLGGDITIFKSAVTGLIIALGEAGLTGALRSLFQAMTDGVRFLTDFGGYMDTVTLAAEAAIVAISALAATQLPLLVLALRVATSGMTASSVALGVFTAAVNRARFATIALGGPLGILWGLIGAAGAAWILFKDDTDDAVASVNDAEDGTIALNAALRVFHATETPAAGRSAIALANDNLTLAKTALDAAEAELALVDAIMVKQRIEASAASSMAGTGMGFFSDQLTAQANQDAADAALAASKQLDSVIMARGVLDDARAALRRAGSAVTGSDFGATLAMTTGTLLKVTDDLLPNLSEISEIIPTIGGGAEDLTDEAETLADKLKGELTRAIDQVSDAFGDWMSRGFKDFGAFAKSILDTFKDMLINMIVMAAKNKIMISLGLGGGSGGLGGVAGSGILGSLMGSFGTAATAGTAAVAGTGVLGGLGAVGTGLMTGGVGGAVAATGTAVSGGLAAGAGVAGAGMALGAIAPWLLLGFALFTIFKKKPPYREKDFDAIQDAIELTNTELLNTGTAGHKAATALKKAFGGLEEMQKATNSYYSNFFTKEEQRLRSAEAIDDVFASRNLATPETAAQFRDMVEAQDLMTKKGRKTYAALINISGAFADLYGGANSVNQAVTAMNGSQGLFATLQDEIFATAAQSNGYIAKLATTREDDSAEVKLLLREIVTAVRSGNINLSRNTAQTVALLERQELDPTT